MARLLTHFLNYELRINNYELLVKLPLFTCLIAYRDISVALTEVFTKVYITVYRMFTKPAASNNFCPSCDRNKLA